MNVGNRVVSALVATAALGCSSGAVVGLDAGSSGSAVMPSVTSGQGLCEPTCPRSCNVDDDCDTELGELCCDYGSGRVCQLASACPVFCADDTSCQTGMGQACVTTSLAAGAQSACNQASAGLQFCRSSADCRGGQTCCTNYDRPICTDALQCPASCTDDSRCNTLDGEICCTTVQAVEPSLGVSGLCLNPAVQACPKACSSSAQCEQTPGARICCNGLCSATCATTCTQDSDCFGEILLQVAHGRPAAAARALRGHPLVHRRDARQHVRGLLRRPRVLQLPRVLHRYQRRSLHRDAFHLDVRVVRRLRLRRVPGLRARRRPGLQREPHVPHVRRVPHRGVQPVERILPWLRADGRSLPGHDSGVRRPRRLVRRDGVHGRRVHVGFERMQRHPFFVRELHHRRIVRGDGVLLVAGHLRGLFDSLRREYAADRVRGGDWLRLGRLHVHRRGDPLRLADGGAVLRQSARLLVEPGWLRFVRRRADAVRRPLHPRRRRG